MDLEGVMLSERSQTEKDKHFRYHLYVEYKKIKQTIDYNKKERELQIQRPGGYSGEKRGEGHEKDTGLRSTNTYV